MKPRHAAALALVGWYLMVPPSPTPEKVRAVLREWEALPENLQGEMTDIAKTAIRWDLGAPLSQWWIMESFDTAANCETRLKRLKDLVVKESENPANAGFLSTQCVATDDPRLKPK